MKTNRSDNCIGENVELEIISAYNRNNLDYMMMMIPQNYKYYAQASPSLKSNYNFSIAAIYSCLSKVNNMENINNSFNELSMFLNYVKANSGISMKPAITSQNTLYVKDRVKIKSLYRKPKAS